MRAASSTVRPPQHHSPESCYGEPHGNIGQRWRSLLPMLRYDVTPTTTRQWNLSPNEFAAALGRGLGRALVHAKRVPLTRAHRRALLKASLAPVQDGPSAEEDMAPWLLDVAQAAGMREHLASAILRRAAACEEDSEERISALLMELAQRDPQRASLYLTARKELEVRNPRIDEDERQTLKDALGQLLPEVFVSSTPEVSPHGGGAISLPRTVQDVLHAAKGSKTYLWFSDWATHASDLELSELADAMFLETDPGVLHRLLLVFVARSLAAFDERFLALCEHPSQSVRCRAMRAIGEYSSPRVRALALSRLDATRFDSYDHAVWLFRNNYEPEDPARLLSFFARPQRSLDEHEIAFDFLEVFDKNPDPRLVPLVEQIYEATPCVHCRERAVERLVEERLAPEWLVEECRFGASAEIREHVGQPGSP